MSNIEIISAADNEQTNSTIKIVIVPGLQPDPAEPAEIATLRAILAYIYPPKPSRIEWTST